MEKEGYVSPFVKILSLEILNMCLSYDFACERFLTFDLTKLESLQSVVEASRERETKDKKRRSKSKDKSHSRSGSRSSKRSKKKKQ